MVAHASGWKVYEQALVQITQADCQPALALLVKAEAIFRTENDAQGLWRALLGQTLLHWQIGALVPAVACALVALQAAETAADWLGVGRVAWQLANIALGQGDYATAAKYLHRAQLALDKVGLAPPGGPLAAAAQLCTEITHWWQVTAGRQLDQWRAEAATSEIRPQLISRLAQATTAMRMIQGDEVVDIAPVVADVPFALALPVGGTTYPAVGIRLLRWWRHLIGREALPDQAPAPISIAALAKMSVTLTETPVPEPFPITPTPLETVVTKVQALGTQRQIVAGRGAGCAVYCFGRFRVYLNDTAVDRWESARGRELFKYLVAHRATPAPKEVLAEQFWADSEPELARRSLHQAIYCLRQTFKRIMPGTSIIQFAGDRYQINPQIPIWVDSEEFSYAIEQANAHDTAGEAGLALDAYALAVDLYSGEFLEEDRYEDWTAELRRTYQAVYLEALHRLARDRYEHHDYPTAIILCQRALVHESCDEQAHQLLMACYVAQNLRHLAVRQYQICVAALKIELGIAPSDELEAFYRYVAANG